MKRTVFFLIMIPVVVLCLHGTAAANEPQTIKIAILEDPEAEPQALDALHNDLVAQGFVLLRPLKGRLEGKGNLWSAPEGMAYPTKRPNKPQPLLQR